MTTFTSIYLNRTEEEETIKLIIIQESLAPKLVNIVEFSTQIQRRNSLVLELLTLSPLMSLTHWQNWKLNFSQTKQEESLTSRPDDFFLQLIRIMISRKWFQAFLYLKLTSPTTWVMLFSETVSCAAYSHPGNERIKLLKLIKSICYTKQIKHCGSFTENQQSKLFPPWHPVRPPSETALFTRFFQLFPSKSVVQGSHWFILPAVSWAAHLHSATFQLF